MKLPLHATIIGALTAIALVGIIVLTAIGRGVPPEILQTVALVGVSALAGLAIPTLTAPVPVVPVPASSPVELDEPVSPRGAVSVDPVEPVGGLTAAQELAARS